MGVVASLILSILAGLMVAELYIWENRISRFLTVWAAKRLPLELKDRLEEEWLSHLDDLPNGVAKLASSMGFHIAATLMCFDYGKYRLKREHFIIARFVGLVAWHGLKFHVRSPVRFSLEGASLYYSAAAALLSWDRRRLLTPRDMPSWKQFSDYVDQNVPSDDAIKAWVTIRLFRNRDL